MEKITVFASGTKDGGGSGFEELVKQSRGGVLDAQVVAVVSNHKNGGVMSRANRLDIPFYFFPKPWNAESYKKIMDKTGGEYAALSGWLKLVEGLDNKKTFNIHPALLSQFNGRFGGEGMWGVNVHNAIKEAYDKGEITESGFSMHFVTDEYDRGPVFFEKKIKIKDGMSAIDIAKAVNDMEHRYQPIVTSLVVNGLIKWDGENKDSLEISDRAIDILKDFEVSLIDEI